VRKGNFNAKQGSEGGGGFSQGDWQFFQGNRSSGKGEREIPPIEQRREKILLQKDLEPDIPNTENAFPCASEGKEGLSQKGTKVTKAVRKKAWLQITHKGGAGGRECRGENGRVAGRVWGAEG